MPTSSALGWIGHYVVGILYGVVFALIVGPEWLAAPRFLPAWLFGLATVAFGWFLLQPGLGTGLGRLEDAEPDEGAAAQPRRPYGVRAGAVSDGAGHPLGGARVPTWPSWGIQGLLWSKIGSAATS